MAPSTRFTSRRPLPPSHKQRWAAILLPAFAGWMTLWLGLRIWGPNLMPHGPTLHDEGRLLPDHQIRAPTYRLDPSFNVDAPPQTRRYTFNITRSLARPDGFLKTIYAVNGQMPGPLIEANEGDTIEVTVHNNIPLPSVVNGNTTAAAASEAHAAASTSIHWHGLIQNGTLAGPPTVRMDGIAGLTQCALAPGHSQIYTIPLVGQSGTYWWHAHVKDQLTNGILGPLIIHSRQEPYRRPLTYDTERILMLQDWHHDDTAKMFDALISPGGYNGSGVAPSPQASLINGRGYFDCNLLPVGRRTPYCRTRWQPRRIFVKRGERVRFRLVNGGSHAQAYVSFDGWKPSLIAADGTGLVSNEVTRVPVHNGERYDVVLDFASRKGPSDFWLRSTLNTNCFATVDATLSRTALVAVHVIDDEERYEALIAAEEFDWNERTLSAAKVKLPPLPTTTDWPDPLPNNCHDPPSELLEPILPEEAAENRDPEALGIFNARFGSLTVVVAPNSTASPPAPPLPAQTANVSRFFVNNVTYDEALHLGAARLPLLASVATTGSSADVVGRNDVAVIEAKDGKWVYDVVINNLDFGPGFAIDHPLHLHGPDFSIVSRGPGPISNVSAWLAAQDHRSARGGFNLTNPMRRDTLVVPGGEHVVLRLTTDIPGTWAVHCHVAQHLHQGFLGALVVHPAEVKTLGQWTKADQEICEENWESQRRFTSRAIERGPDGTAPEHDEMRHRTRAVKDRF